MGLKKSDKCKLYEGCINPQEKIDVLEKKIGEVCLEISHLESKKKELRNELAAVRILPFKPGDKVMCEVTSGRRREAKKCVIEIEDGIVYVRPFLKDTDELSGRHFSVIAPNGNYSTVFKKV